MRALLYIEAENLSKAKTIIFTILGKDYFEHAFTSDLYFLDKLKQTQMTIDLLKMLKEEESLKDLFDSLIFYLSYHSRGEFRQALEQNFLTLNTPSKIKAKYDSHRYGSRLPYVWAPFIFENKSSKEYQEFINRRFKVNDKLSRADLLFFRGIDGLDKKFRSAILEEFLTPVSKGSNYDDYLYFLLLENDDFYRLIDNHSKKKIGLMINAKRRFLLNLLTIPNLKEFALLGLWKIGDIRTSYIENDILSYE